MNCGKRGEELALADYLADGYTEVLVNYRTRQGEVDLIVKKEGVLVFAEVKARSGNPIARPCEWVDEKKQHKIRASALQYLAKHQLCDPPLRFDVVEVSFTPGGTAYLHRIENAF